jgi:hypothetical protein
MKPLILIAFVSLLFGMPCLAQSVGPTNPTPAVVLAWDRSPGTNVITNYTVYYGVASATYTDKALAGTNLTVTVSNLLRGTTYFFAATATDTKGLESGYSNEVSCKLPSPPAPPATLRIITAN